MSNFECWFCDKGFLSSLELWLHTIEIHEGKEVKVEGSQKQT
jgi:hypothetical protein